MDKNIKKMIEDEENRIKRMRSVIAAKYAENLIIEDGKIVSVKFSTSGIAEMVEAEDHLMKMERRAAGFPKELQ